MNGGRSGGVVDLYIEGAEWPTGVVMTMDGESKFCRGVDLPEEDVGEDSLGDMPSHPLTPAANLRDRLLLFGVYFGVSREMRFLRAREMLDGVWELACGIAMSIRGSLCTAFLRTGSFDSWHALSSSSASSTRQRLDASESGSIKKDSRVVSTSPGASIREVVRLKKSVSEHFSS